MSIEGPSKDSRLPFFPCQPCVTWQTVSEVVCLLILIGHTLAYFGKWARPFPPPRAACRIGLSASDPMRSEWRGDCPFAVVEDESPSLERSGCRMSVSGSSPGGLKEVPTTL